MFTVLITLCVDTSRSMRKRPDGSEPIELLNAALAKFFTALDKEETFREDVFVAVVGFANKAEVLRDFATIGSDPRPPEIDLSTGTNIPGGVEAALDLLKKGEEHYASVRGQVDWLYVVVLSDGRCEERYKCNLPKAADTFKGWVEDSSSESGPRTIPALVRVGTSPGGDLDLFGKPVNLPKWDYITLFHHIFVSLQDVKKSITSGQSPESVRGDLIRQVNDLPPVSVRKLELGNPDQRTHNDENA